MNTPINLKTLQEELQQAGNPWQMTEVNSMTELTEDQRRLRLGFQPGPDDLPLKKPLSGQKKMLKLYRRMPLISVYRPVLTTEVSMAAITRHRLKIKGAAAVVFLTA